MQSMTALKKDMQQNLDVVACLKYYNEYLSAHNILHDCITCIERRSVCALVENNTHTKKANYVQPRVGNSQILQF